MNDEIFDKYREAGLLAAKILRDGAKEIRIGASYLDIIESIESRVTEDGAALAFPLNLSLNEDAAHDTASPGDTRILTKGDVAKLDLGVQVDGYIADTATTVDLGVNSLLVDASKQALEAAIGIIRPGVTAGDLGMAVQTTIENRGYRPIANLTGHGLDKYVLHRSPTIPNIGIKGGMVLEEGWSLPLNHSRQPAAGMSWKKQGRRFTPRSPKNPSGSLPAGQFLNRSGTATGSRFRGAG